MMASFSPLKRVDLKLLTDKAIELGCSVNYLEKDYYAVHLIKCLQTFIVEDGSLIFTGGTALAKGYKLLERFSEDCDFILLKRDCNRKDRSHLREKLLSHLKQEGFHIKNDKSQNESRNWLFEIEYERLSQAEDSLRRDLKLEIVHKEVKIGELTKNSVQSFLAESKQDIPEVTSIDCLSIEEICAGKLSALIWRYLLEESKNREPQQIRHLYDISALTPILSGSHTFKNIFKLVVDEDLKERATLPMALPEALEKILRELTTNVVHKENYENYVKNYIYGHSPNQLSFEEAAQRLRTLIESL